VIEILDRFPGTSVLVVGDVMLDEYIWGEVRRVSPEAPVPVVEIRTRTYVPGGAGNVASGVAGLGGIARLAGVVGEDASARLLLDSLERAGVESGLTPDPSRPTTTKTRIVAQSQQVVRADSEDRAPLATEVADRVVSWIEGRVADTDALVLSDYAKGVVSPELAGRVIELARDAGKPVVADPKGSDYAKYRGATVVTPNIHEAKRAAGLDGDAHHELSEVGGRLAELLGGSALLVTRGAQGMSLFPNGSEPPVDIPSRARNVFDVTGAGDAVVSTLALALGCGAPLEEAASLANAAAGVAVGKVGTQTLALDELREAAATL
jgi:D-beta-D-heptose 7-phosphate kinase/D-beta-D-heptose 1-phosphate adenosyltransferase